MGFRFFSDYFTYLNNSKTQYANNLYPYQELVLTTKNLVDRRFLTQEKLTYLADYVSQKDNFFPFSQLHFTIKGTELLASSALKTLIKNAATHQLGEISIDFDRSESAKTDPALKEAEDQLVKEHCADLVAFIEKEKIHTIVTLSTNELDVDEKELTAVELACRENKRAHYAASQQESKTEQAKKQSEDHYHFDSRLIHSYKTMPIQDLDVHVDQVQEQHQEMQHEELLNVDEQVYAENKQETEMDLDCDQDQTGAVVRVISDEKNLCEEFLKYSKFGWNIGAMLWKALFDSKRRYALSGVTTAAAEKLYQFSSVFKHGLKLNNRPDGFFIYKEAENNYILGYNEFYTSKNEKTPLTPILEASNKKMASVMSYQAPGRDLTFGKYFDQQRYSEGKPSFRTKGKQSSSLPALPTDLGFSKLCGLDEKYKMALNELLACVNEKDRIDVLDLFAALYLDQDKLGVTRFLDFASKIRSLNSESFGLFLSAFIKPTNERGIDLSLFTTEESIAALEKLKQLSPEHFKIWLELATSSSKDKRNTENFVASVERFCYFLTEFKRITGKTTPPQSFPIHRIVSGVQLDLYLGILELAKDKAEQLKTINQLPDYETAYYAMQHEGFQFVSHEMGLVREAGNTYAVSEGHLLQMVQDEKKTAHEYEIICHRYFGMHQHS